MSQTSTLDTTKSVDFSNKSHSRKISSILCEILKENTGLKVDNEMVQKQKKLSFYSKNKASIAVPDFLDRILKYTKIEESTMIVALIYIDRVCDYNSFVLTDRNIHRIILASIVVSVKYNEDDIYTNNYYAKVGGISKYELNNLEVEFVKLLKYSLFVKEDTFNQYRIYLKQYKKEEY